MGSKYSGLSNVVSRLEAALGSLPEHLRADELLGRLKNLASKGEVAPAELRWTGLDALLQGRGKDVVQTAEILQHALDNRLPTLTPKVLKGDHAFYGYGADGHPLILPGDQSNYTERLWHQGKTGPSAKKPFYTSTEHFNFPPADHPRQQEATATKSRLNSAELGRNLLFSTRATDRVAPVSGLPYRIVEELQSDLANHAGNFGTAAHPLTSLPRHAQVTGPAPMGKSTPIGVVYDEAAKQWVPGPPKYAADEPVYRVMHHSPGEENPRVAGVGRSPEDATQDALATFYKPRQAPDSSWVNESAQGVPLWQRAAVLSEINQAAKEGVPSLGFTTAAQQRARYSSENPKAFASTYDVNTPKVLKAVAKQYGVPVDQALTHITTDAGDIVPALQLPERLARYIAANPLKLASGAGLAALGASALPSSAFASTEGPMDNMPSPRAVLADPRLAEEHPEQRAARLGAERADRLSKAYAPRTTEEQVANRLAGEDWRNRFNDDKPYSLSDLIHRDLAAPGVTSDLLGEVVGPLGLLSLMNSLGPQAAAFALMPSALNKDDAESLARLAEHGLGYLSAERPPQGPSPTWLAENIPAGYDLDLPDMPAYSEPERATLVAGGYKAPRMAQGGLATLR